jgi:cyclophilin family peptidyl-prolyl cis-trans isomerase
MTKKFFSYILLIVVLVVAIILITRSTSTNATSEISAEAAAVEFLDEKITNDNNDNEFMDTDAQNPIAVMQTNYGTIEIELFKNLAPKTVENFVTLSQNNFYDGVRFHRVIEGFMIQGGDPLSKDQAMIDRWGTGGPGYTFEDEIHTENSNAIGTISMANAGPNTNGSQFFINVADNSYLNDKHTVFGKVISGYDDVVEKIALVDTLPGINRPTEDVIIEKIEIK